MTNRHRAPSAWPDAALVLGFAAVALVFCHCGHAAAQPRNPFNVGITEGGGAPVGITGWIMARQIAFEQLLSGAVRAVRTSNAGLWALCGLSFAYGVFHAAGPGHGKAVVASYMIANERALRRGLVISSLAALLQGLVAVAIIAVFALVLRATAPRMRDAAHFVEEASFAGVTLLGAWLVWRKGRALLALVRIPSPKMVPAGVNSRFACEACDDDSHVHDASCGHFHMPDPGTLGSGFSWRDAMMTVLAAGTRPCSGAILVLVFALAQGIFYAGVVATLAMSLGTAITTGALAIMAVLVKKVAMRLASATSRRGLVVARGFEFAAACLVLILGVLLLQGYAAAGI
jgi:ABC-type nickel/cobalt efflux system permease component RcnA